MSQCSGPVAAPSMERPPNGSPNGFVVYTAGRNWDFEEGLAGWTPTGTAFTNQPTLGDNVVAARVRSDMTLERGGIGGDYWMRVPYPIGHHLSAWIGTNENHPASNTALGFLAGDARIGTLTSGEFDLDEAHRFIAFMVGGGRDVATERVELQIRGENENDVAELTRLIGGNRDAAAGLATLFGGTTRPSGNAVGSLMATTSSRSPQADKTPRSCGQSYSKSPLLCAAGTDESGSSTTPGIRGDTSTSTTSVSERPVRQSERGRSGDSPIHTHIP